MLESELFAFLEHTSDAAYSVTSSGEVCSWNSAARQLFGYTAAEALGRNIDDLLDARDSLGTPALAGGSDGAVRQWTYESGGIPHFDLLVKERSGRRLWINVSTIIFDNQRTGRRLYVRLARNVDEHRRKEALLAGLVDVAHEIVEFTSDPTDHAPVDQLSEQERRILKLFAAGQKPAAIASQLTISPQTLRNHLHHINRKLRTHNRLEAVVHAQRRGLID
jgi:PAS domain S-box-containing protein